MAATRVGRERGLGELGRDARYAMRSLWRSPGYTVIAVLTLAVGIGATTAMFSAIHGVLLRRLPMRAQNNIVAIWLQPAAGGVDHWPVDYRDIIEFRTATHAFESVAGVNFQGASQVVMLEAGRPVSLDASWVTGNFFSVLGVSPALGRFLSPTDDVPGAAPVTVISYAFWQRQFGGDPSAIGHTLQWNDKSYTIVGVAPRDFEYPRHVEAWFAVLPWFPATQDINSSSGLVIQFDLVGRLHPGVGVRGATNDYQAYLRSTDQEREVEARGARPIVTPLPTLVVGNMKSILWTGGVAVGLLLLIACINVANLSLIRASARGTELSIRVALGAGKRRLLRQVLTESGIVALFGGVLGVVLAIVAVRAALTLAPAELPRRDAIEMDAVVLLFAVGLTAVTMLIAGLVPAIVTVGGDLSLSLRAGRSGASVSRRTQALRHGLVVGQISLAFLVAIAAGLLARSLAALTGVDMGFNPNRLLVVETIIPAELVPDRNQQLALEDQLLARVNTLPGVLSAAVMPKPPFSAQGGWFGMVTGEGQTMTEQKTNPLANTEIVSPSYFHTLQIPLLLGREFTEQDREHTVPVAVISDALARHVWPRENPIGKRIKFGAPDSPGDWLTVIGTVGETRYHELTALEPSVYVPVRQTDAPVPMTLAVRTQGDPQLIIPQLRKTLEQINPAWRIAGGGPMRQLLAAPLARPRFSTVLFVAFATITVLLAIVGIYGALAATVGQRSREMGIRLALGAAVEDVRGLVLRQGMGLAAVGCLLGLVAALVGSRVLRNLLFGVAPDDPITFVAVAALILAAATLACYVPARRATRVDPLVTLRAE